MDDLPTLKALLWVLGAFGELERLRLIKAPFKLTAFGVAQWDQLDTEWRPTDEQIGSALAKLATKRRERRVLAVLLRDYRDNRERIENWVARRRADRMGEQAES